MRRVITERALKALTIENGIMTRIGRKAKRDHTDKLTLRQINKEINKVRRHRSDHSL